MSRAYVWKVPQDHDALLDDRDKRGLGFKRCRPTTATAKEKEGRYKLLKSGETVAVATATVVAVEPVRDGLVWLIRKKRLSPSQLKAALFVKAMSIAAVEGGLKSSLNFVVGKGGGEAEAYVRVQAAAASVSTAKRNLFIVRNVWLSGVTDMLTVIDGVVIGGQSLRQLAGEGHRAKELEAVLKVALDLIAVHLTRAQKKAA